MKKLMKKAFLMMTIPMQGVKKRVKKWLKNSQNIFPVLWYALQQFLQTGDRKSVV